MNESPIPQPSGATCPNCGAAQPTNAARCANCGAPLARESPSLAASIAKFLACAFLLLLALALGVFAACLPVMDSIGSGSSKTSPEIYLLSGVSILAALGCIWGIFRIFRKS